MPKISIITVNLNNATGLQKTVESVFAQTFCDYEYIIIDGGSTDGSKELIKKHQNKLSYWVSEKDKGIYNAMNKGIIKAKGELVIFLNSGDYYVSSNLFLVVNNKFNLEKAEIFYCAYIWESSLNNQIVLSYNDKVKYDSDLKKSNFPHPGTFYKRSAFSKVGLFNEDYKILGDYEWNARALIKYRLPFQTFDIITALFIADGISNKPELKNTRNEEKRRIDEIYFSTSTRKLLNGSLTKLFKKRLNQIH